MWYAQKTWLESDHLVKFGELWLSKTESIIWWLINMLRISGVTVNKLDL